MEASLLVFLVEIVVDGVVVDVVVVVVAVVVDVVVVVVVVVALVEFGFSGLLVAVNSFGSSIRVLVAAELFAELSTADLLCLSTRVPFLSLVGSGAVFLPGLL